MGTPSVRRHGQLQTLAFQLPNNGGLIPDLIESIYRIRYSRLPTAQTSLTIDSSYIGATIIVTAASAFTLTLPANTAGTTGRVGNGFICEILVLGAGSVTISGTKVGGSTVAQNGTAILRTLDDGSWFVTGAA